MPSRSSQGKFAPLVARARGGASVGLIVGLVVGGAALFVVLLAAVLAPVFNEARAAAEDAIVRDAISRDYERLERGEPIPSEPVTRRKTPLSNVANLMRELVRGLAQVYGSYDSEASDAAYSLVHEYDTFRAETAFRRAMQDVARYHEPDEAYFKKWFELIDTFAARLKVAAGSDELAMKVVEEQLSYFKRLRGLWGTQLAADKRVEELLLKRARLLWNNRRHLREGEAGVELAPSTGRSARNALGKIDSGIVAARKEYDRLQKLIDRL